MSVQFQYNRTSLHDLNKQLKIRKAVLPILKSKETALRVVVNQKQKSLEEKRKSLEEIKASGESLIPLMARFPFKKLECEELQVTREKVAGVQVPVFSSIRLELKEILWHQAPHWFSDVRNYLKAWSVAEAQVTIASEQLRILELERKKTTQKVNLFEKVQIPDYEVAIKKIRKYLEDKENLSKAAQKIVKTRKLV